MKDKKVILRYEAKTSAMFKLIQMSRDTLTYWETRKYKTSINFDYIAQKITLNQIINPRLRSGPMKKYIIFISLSICPSSNTGNSYETSPQKIIANYSCLQFTNGNNSFIISILNTGFSSQIISLSLIMNRTVRVTNHNTHEWITWNQLIQFYNGVHLWAMKIWI